ncbi:MAG: bifunctional oligoribonuclease/PAP phosphatase NrnA [Clostridia bacterium]|nr:bifunctional oligoribonuclease/PAP phosphatase NrnA [Clostridia bacterium]
MENKTQLLSLEETARFLRENNNYLILTHASPDGDTLGSAHALLMILAKLGKNATVICSDEIPNKYNYFIDTACYTAKEDFTVIAVDVADTKLLGSLEEKYSKNIELCIDHHMSNTGYAKRTYLDSSAGANCECIFDIAGCLGVEIDKKMALALYTGISTDTGCFRFSNTTAKTLRIGAALMETGIDTAEINRIMFETKSRLRLQLEKMALDNMEFYFNDSCAVITITRQMYEQTGCKDQDIDGITAIPRTIEGVLVGVTIREKEDGSFKASVRTYPPVDASKICGLLGGGGHIRASGCQISNKYSLDQAKEKILLAVRAVLEEESAGVTADK